MKRRRNTLAQVKGYRHGRGSKEAMAREAIRHAGQHAFAHRKDKKGDRRSLNQVKVNAGVRATTGVSYSKFMDALKKKNIKLDRKILAILAEKHPKTFERIAKSVA